ncbi:MAG TPA: peptide-methionine (S)-S-oxide reductase MsrA [Longimicrobiales bacterium]|nr:peptide-methionine (S)-S-oxide reductase MsrA [Longimicrobiales bacterium]
MSLEYATLGGGCFWCLEAAFARVRGVSSVESGYAGGLGPDPTYHEVCTGRTGHAEVVRLAFDPDVVSFRELLEVFFTIHDPTTLNRQGADVGTQYRSVIFHESPQQERTARALIDELSAAAVWADPIVTEVAPLPAFYPAEAYHRDYYARNPAQAYCQLVIAPKLAKLRASARELLRADES